MTTSQFAETRFSNAARQVWGGFWRRPDLSAGHDARRAHTNDSLPRRLQTRTSPRFAPGRRGISRDAGRRQGTSIGMALNHADDARQLQLAERTPPFAMLVPKGQTPEMFALHQHHLVHRRQDAVFIVAARGRERIRHASNIGRPTTIGSPDFVKNSTTLGVTRKKPCSLHIASPPAREIIRFLDCQPPSPVLKFLVHGGI
jgi:hypothetical protein